MAMPVALRVMEGHARVYRGTWKGSAVSTFLNPVLFLLAMGLGLGSLVDRSAGQADLGVSYLAFLAPGLLAASAMQAGAADGSWPVMAGIKWTKTYHAALATPVGNADLVAGHLMWVAVRLALTTVVFAVVTALFGAVAPLPGLLAVGPAILTGMAFAAPVTAYAARLKDEAGLSSLFRFGIVPMFLFSGTFFPVTQLPGWLQPLAYLTPLWHGVELTRGAALGIQPALAPVAHVAYLLLWTAVGARLAVHNFRRRLEQ
ncbi:MAG: ABC transporter permease [Actinomycetota bacterium]|nr:ABC transporter permease [Actinomycetota bacterium]